VGYVEQAQQITPAIVEGVAVELELETQPFFLSSAAMDSRGAHFGSGDAASFRTTFNGEPTGRQDR
jgi:hypothetical protein